MKLVIDISEELYDDIKYNFEKKYYCDCGGYLISSTIVNGTPFEKELEKIKIEAEKNSFKKYNINNEFKCFAIEFPTLNRIINDYIEELKGK